MAISAFTLFNALSPKELTSRQVAGDVPYGPAARHRLDIYAPRRGSGPLPVIFFVYGGSWSDGDRRNYSFAGRSLAALGYVVVIADYRLLPAVEYPTFLVDCADAFEAMLGMVSRFGGDPSRVALMGHSAGAYNAVMLALHPDYLAARQLTASVRCFIGLSGPYDFLPFDGPISLRTFGAVRQPEETQPVNHVSGGALPAFLGHGRRDRLVLPRNTEVLAERLRARGGATTERYYEGLSHAAPLLALGVPLRWLAPVRADVARFLRDQFGTRGPA